SAESACFEREDATTASAEWNAQHGRVARTRLGIACLLWGLVFSLTARVLEADDVAPNLSGLGMGIDHNNIAVIINTADSLSLAAGEYYARVRQVPSSNLIRVRFAPGAPELPVDEFRRLRARVEASAPPLIQAYALTWAAPYRVGCMSITSAFAFG